MMIERLQRALERVEQLPPEAQEDLAQHIEELTEPLANLRAGEGLAADLTLPQSVRDALALAGAWSGLQGDDEFAALDRIRQESQPTPPVDEQLAWLDDNQQ